MDKPRIKIVIKGLGEVKTEYPQTEEFIDELLEQECRKENMSLDEIILIL